MANRRKGNTTARGYGHRHQALRRQWEPYIAAGQCTCTRCGELITPGQAWHLDHTDDRTGYAGPAHATCNMAAGGRKNRRPIDPKPRPRTRW